MQTPPSPVLTSTLPAGAFIAGASACLAALLVALVVEIPQHSRHAGEEVLVVATILVLFLVPGFLLFSAFLSCGSWIWHGTGEAPRPIWVDAFLGLIGGLTLGGSYLAQDVLGVRPDELNDVMGRNVSIVVLTTVLFGGGMGFASGGITRFVLARMRKSDATASRLTSVINLVFVFATTVPGLSMIFTFAHFTGRTSGWEVLATPFVFLMAVGTIGGLGAGHMVVLSLLVIAHRALLDGRGTVIAEVVASIGGAALALVVGLSFFEHGMDNFADGLSFGVAVSATLGVAMLLALIMGLGWRKTAEAPPS